MKKKPTEKKAQGKKVLQETDPTQETDLTQEAAEKRRRPLIFPAKVDEMEEVATIMLRHPMAHDMLDVLMGVCRMKASLRGIYMTPIVQRGTDAPPFATVGEWVFGVHKTHGHLRITRPPTYGAYALHYPRRAPKEARRLIEGLVEAIESERLSLFTEQEEIGGRAYTWAQSQFPTAARERWSSFANAAVYMRTGGSGLQPGPSMREHLVRRMTLPELRSDHDAYKVLGAPDGPVFGRPRPILAEIWTTERCVGDAAADVRYVLLDDRSA